MKENTMDEFENTRKFWGSEILRGNLIWPDEHVIRFVKRNCKPGAVVLDYGCGLGRNAVALAKEGYHLIAMDYTEEAVSAVKQKSRKLHLPIKEVKNIGLEIPLPELSVDVVVADGSLFYNKKKDNIEILSNLAKCLKNEGKIWANWRTKRDSLYKQGIEMGDGLMKLKHGTKREGCCYFFADEKDIADMYESAGFVIEAIDEFDYTENNRESKCSYFHVSAHKNNHGK